MSSKEYPAWRFGPNATSVVVLSPEEDSMLGSEWSDKPPEDFNPEGHPTFRTVEMAAAEDKLQAAERAVAERKVVVEAADARRPKEPEPVRNKPGPKPKVQEG